LRSPRLLYIASLRLGGFAFSANNGRRFSRVKIEIA
jgi:hypothetical protein